MSGAGHGGKGDDRRPEAERGAYGRGFDAIDWTARDRSATGIAVARSDTRPAGAGATRTPDAPSGKGSS